MTVLYAAMAAVFRRWQDESCLSYGDIARRSGMSVPGVSEVMRGINVPRPETVAAVCAALGRTEDDLLRAMAEEAR